MDNIAPQLVLGAIVFEDGPVVFTDVGRKWNVVGVERPLVNIVEDLAHRLLIRRQRVEDRNSGRSIVTCAYFHRGPKIRKMKSGVPDAGATHGKSPQRHAFRIDLIGAIREVYRLENISLSRPVIGVLATSE